MRKPLSLLILIPLFLSACAPLAEPPPPTPSPQRLTKNELVLIPEGWFLMGENNGLRANEPQHQVFLDAYLIQKTEVTNQAFAAFILASHHQMPGWNPRLAVEKPFHPVTNTLWKDADAYCQWLGMRLPTEAEWEKAARGEIGLVYPWGNEWVVGVANTAESGSGAVTTVGSYPEGASPYGLLDMAGNAAEWVADYFDPGYYQVSPTHNPTGPDQVLDHGLRGGSYESPADQAAAYFRDSSHSAEPNPRAGFRCASDP